MSLTSGVKFGHRETDAILMLLHALDHVLFQPEQCGFAQPWTDNDSLVWGQTQQTLRRASFRVRMDAVLAITGGVS